MGSRYEVEVTIISAKDLKNVNWRHGNLTPYAVVWIDPKTKCSTPVDDSGDTSPFWGHNLLIPFTTPIDDSTLHIDIVHAAAAEDTKPLVGSARLPLRDLVDAERSFQLKRPSGRPQGKVEIAVTVREAGYPYYAPPPAAAGIRDYPPPPYASPYGVPAYAPPASYGQSSYYGQAEYVEEKKKSSFGFGGMGTGLAVGAVAGVLGGIALAEGVDALEDNIADDVEERVEDDEDY